MKKIVHLLVLLSLVLCDVSAQTIGVFKSTAPATNGEITADLKIGTGKTLSGTGTFNFSTGTLTVATDQILWASVNKSGSSLAQLATRSASDLSSGTLPDARFPATLPALNGSLLTALNATQLTTGTVPTARLYTTAAGYAITNGAAIDALGAVATNGALTRTAANTYAARTLTGTAGQVTVTNGDGVAGNPTVSLPTALTSINSVTSAALANLTLGTGTFGTALTFTSATGAASILNSATDTLTIASNSVTGYASLRGNTSAGASAFTLGFGNSGVASPLTSATYLYTNGNPFIYYINGVDQGRVTTTGNFLIGTSTDMTGSGGLKVGGTTASTSPSTGALLVSGGVGISGATWMGGRLNVESTFSTPGRFVSSDINASIQIHSTATGANTAGWQLISGGTGSVVGANAFGVYDSGAGVTRLTLAPNGGGSTFTIPSTASAKAILDTSGNSPSLNLVSNAQANYRTLKFSQGATPTTLWQVGYQGATADTNLNFEPSDLSYVARFTGTATATSTTTGALQVAGGLGIGLASYFGGQANFQSSQPQIVLGTGSTATTQIGFLYTSAGQYVGLTGNRNPATGVFPNTLGTHAEMAFDTGAAGSSITFRTSPTANTLGNIALFINKNGGIEAASPTGGLGYGTGAGGTVTQITSRTTGVTLAKVTGAITLFTAAGTATPTSFTVTNSAVAATDTVVLSVKSSTNKYNAYVTAVGAGSFEITFEATSGTASDAPVINFAVIKAVTS